MPQRPKARMAQLGVGSIVLRVEQHKSDRMKAQSDSDTEADTSLPSHQCSLFHSIFAWIGGLPEMLEERIASLTFKVVKTSLACHA